MRLEVSNLALIDPQDCVVVKADLGLRGSGGLRDPLHSEASPRLGSKPWLEFLRDPRVSSPV